MVIYKTFLCCSSVQKFFQILLSLPSDHLSYGQLSVSQLPFLPASILILNIRTGISQGGLLGFGKRNCYYEL